MEKIIIETKIGNNQNAGSKARDDVNFILSSMGFKIRNIQIPNYKNNFEIILDIKRLYNEFKKQLEEMPNDSTLVFQFPWNSLSLKFATTMKKIAKRKKIKTIVIIHDINSLRTGSLIGKLYAKFYVNEIKFLDSFDYIICHNQKMMNYLVNNGINEEKIVPLGIFDYLLGESNKIETSDFKRVNIAGNLSKSKSEYIYKLNELNPKSFKFELYGSNYTGEGKKNIKYNGSFSPENLTKELNSGFGLVWDGKNTDTCNGNYGNYLKWNNPHKLSLYMSCGMPVIIWKNAALKDFVLNNGVGIAVDSLNELNEVFNNMTKNDYENYVLNVRKIQKKVTNGEFLKEAMKKVK